MVKQLKSDWRSRMNMSFKRPDRKTVTKSKSVKKSRIGRNIKKRRYFVPGAKGPRAIPDYWQLGFGVGKNTTKANRLEQEEEDLVKYLKSKAKSYCKQGYAINKFLVDKADKGNNKSDDEESAEEWSSSDEDEDEIDYGSDDEDFC